MKRHKIFGTLVLFGLIGLGIAAIVIAQQTITYTTYYPAPYGEYQTLTARDAKASFLEVEADNDPNTLDLVVGQRDWSQNPPPVLQAAQTEFVGDVVVGRGNEVIGLTLNGVTIRRWSDIVSQSTPPVAYRHEVLGDGSKIAFPNGAGDNCAYVPSNDPSVADESFWYVDGQCVPLQESECIWFVSPRKMNHPDSAGAGTDETWCFTDSVDDFDDVDGIGRIVQCFSKDSAGALSSAGILANTFIMCTYGATGQVGGSACGAGGCQPGETCANCPGDCPRNPALCGNGTCNGAAPYCETASNCFADCGSGGGDDGISCVSEDSLITASGEGRIPVKEVEVEDSVLTYDFSEGKAKWARVSAVWREHRSRLYVIKTASRTLKVTADHRLPTPWGDTSGKLAQVGTPLYIWEEGALKEEKVESVSVEKGKFSVYNLTLAETHLYFADGVLVHNVKCDYCGGNVP